AVDNRTCPVSTTTTGFVIAAICAARVDAATPRFLAANRMRSIVSGEYRRAFSFSTRDLLPASISSCERDGTITCAESSNRNERPDLSEPPSLQICETRVTETPNARLAAVLLGNISPVSRQTIGRDRASLTFSLLCVSRLARWDKMKLISSPEGSAPNKAKCLPQLLF